MHRFEQPVHLPRKQYWLIVALLVLAFFAGGSSRADVTSLAVLSPISVLACGWACWTIQKAHFEDRKVLFACLGTMGLYLFLHLIPLPPAVWHSLPGHEEVISIDTLTGIEDVWRPLTVTPMKAWHAIFSFFLPFAVILFGIQLRRDENARLLTLVVLLACASGFLGVLQLASSNESLLYFYSVTNYGSAVGFFANRNNAATLLACLFPMLTVYVATTTRVAGRHSLQTFAAIIVAIMLVPLILITGSRAGAINAVIALSASTLIYAATYLSPIGLKRTIKSSRMVALVIAAGMTVVMGLITVIFSRAEAIERLFSKSLHEESRTEFWEISYSIFLKYFPFGSGSGSFAEAYAVLEPQAALDPTYLNNAHNDWIEILATFGLGGIIFVIVAFCMYVVRGYNMWKMHRQDRQLILFGDMAGVCIGIIGIASITDYPLRTPAFICVFAVLIVWYTLPPKRQS